MTLDSRLVSPGDVYVALPGRTHHGAEFAAEAVGRGAVAVLLTDVEWRPRDWPVPLRPAGRRSSDEIHGGRWPGSPRGSTANRAGP